MYATILFIIGAFCIIAGYDLFTISKCGLQSSITDVTRAAGLRWTFFPYVFAFALGCLFGHFFL